MLSDVKGNFFESVSRIPEMTPIFQLYGSVGIAERKASIFSVRTSGGIPPPQERIMRLFSSIESNAAFTLLRTWSGVPAARTSRGGMLPSRVTMLFVSFFISATVWSELKL